MAQRDRDARVALLERQLRALGPQLAVDASDVASAVRRRIESGPTADDLDSVPDGARTHARRRVLIAIVAVVLVVAVTTLAIGRTRNAVADWLGLRGVEVEHSPEPPQGLGTDLQLGRPVSLADARDALDFGPLVPNRAQFGAPDDVFVAARPEGGRVSLLYAPSSELPPAAASRVGLLVTEFQGTVDEPVIRKTAGPDTTVETLEVNGQRAYWLEGEPHGVAFTDRNGTTFQDRVRFSGNTLLFGDGPLTIRIESGLTKSEALAVARSMERLR